MKRFLTFLVLLPSVAMATDIVEKMAKRGEVTYTDVPRHVLAFYYPWYGTPEFDGNWAHWGKPDFKKKDLPESLRYPVLGPYSCHDPKVIGEHMRMMVVTGITGVIVSWWGQRDFTDRAMPLILDECQKRGMKATIYYERVPKPNDPRTAIADFDYVVKEYGSHSAFLRLGNKPVIVVYGRAMGQLSLFQWTDVIEETKVIAVADGYSPGNAMVFDGVHTYNPVNLYTNKTLDEIRSTAKNNSGEWVRLAREHRKISVATVLPGYDDTKIRSPGLRLDRFDGRLYDILWEEAIAANPDWVFVTSFNELHEGSEIEPTVELRDLYLQKTAAHARRFVKSPPVKVPPIGKPAATKTLPAEWQALVQQYHDVKIGAFGDVAVSVIRLRQLGFKVEFLRWGDIVSEETLTPGNYPLLYFCGTENYVHSVKQDGDVIASLQKYLRDGGAVLVVPQAPFPFFYDESRRPRAASDELGLPILGAGARVAAEGPASHIGGFESPPANVALRFQVNTAALSHVPALVSFPGSGSLKFRPVSNVGLAEGDLYVPLLRTVDAEGSWYGDAAAYIEHKNSEPRGAKLLYVWFRIPDVVSWDDLYHDLLSFLRPKLST